jgi:tetratricopeptide (TPR) repeat protein
MKKELIGGRFRIFISAVLLLWGYIPSAFSQQNKADSLENLLSLAKEDSVKIKLLDQLAGVYLATDFDKALFYASKEMELAVKNKLKKQEGSSLNNMAMAHYFMGNYEKSIQHYFEALKAFEAVSDKKGIALTLNFIGNFQRKQGSYPKALEYLQQAQKIFSEINDQHGLAICYDNIGVVYDEMKDYDKALDFYLKSLFIDKALKSNADIPYSLTYAADIYARKGLYQKALDFYLEALKIREDLNDKPGISIIFTNIGEMYLGRGDKTKAVEYLAKGLEIAKAINYKQLIQHLYTTLAEIFSKNSDYKKAYEYHVLSSQIKDSIFTEQNSKQIHEISAKYETEKKEQEIKLLNKDKEKQAAVSEADNRRKNIIIWSVASGLLLALIFTAYVFSSLRISRKQKEIIEAKQKEILDSIHYAKRIQQSLLPTEKYIERNLNRLNNKNRS